MYEDMKTSHNWLDRAVNQMSSQKMEVCMCLSDYRILYRYLGKVKKVLKYGI